MIELSQQSFINFFLYFSDSCHQKSEKWLCYFWTQPKTLLIIFVCTMHSIYEGKNFHCVAESLCCCKRWTFTPMDSSLCISNLLKKTRQLVLPNLDPVDISSLVEQRFALLLLWGNSISHPPKLVTLKGKVWQVWNLVDKLN